jgi:hypothetical protein
MTTEAAMDSAEGLPLEAEAEEEAAAPYVTPPGPVTTVAALRPGTSGHELTLKVLSSKLVRPGARISEAVVGDASGVVVMTCRNAQIEVVKAGAVITVKNGSVDMYKVSTVLPSTETKQIAKPDSPLPPFTILLGPVMHMYDYAHRFELVHSWNGL